MKYPFLAVFLCAVASFTVPRAEAQMESAVVPHRYIIVYRNATIPGDVEVRARAVGTTILQRNERFGLAVVADAGTDDATSIRRFASQPNVEFVIHDRIVSAGTLILNPIQLHPTGPHNGLRAEPLPSLPPVMSPVQAPNQTSAPLTPAPQPAPYDTYYNSPQGWAIRQVGGYGNNVPGGPLHGPWDTTIGKGVRIAILDSGIDAAHPDLAPNLVLNLTEVNQDATTGLPSICDDGTPQDQSGHGTWTASLAAAAIGQGTGNMIGVAPGASLLNIKVLQRMPGAGTDPFSQCNGGQASGLLSWVIQGIQDAIANHADVISMSLGTTIDLKSGEGAGLKAAFDRVTYAASQAGAVLIASAGNDGYNLTNPRYIELPAQARNVLAVVASTNQECAQNAAPGASCTPGPTALAYYSNYGAPLNALAAPGGSYPSNPNPTSSDSSASGWVRGACSSGKPSTVDGLPSDANHSFGCFNLEHAAYVQAIGTSASAPLAAGVVALLRSLHPDWTADAIVAALRTTAIATPGLPVPQINAVMAMAATR